MKTISSRCQLDITDKLSYLIVLAARLHLREANAAVKHLGLTESQCCILYGIRFLTEHRDKVSQNEVIKHLELNKAMASTVLKGLVSKGLVLREEDSTDSRVKKLSLTPAGVEMLEKVRPVFLDLEYRLVRSKNIDFDALRHALLTILELNE